MTRAHDVIDELLAARALGGLGDEDASLLEREMATHGDCEDCRRLEIEHREVAGALALALDPLPVEDAVVERILGPERPAMGEAAAPPQDLGARRDARLGRWRAAFGVAAAVALVLAVALVTRPGDRETFPAETIVAFEGGPGELAAAYTPGESGVVVWGTNLPDPGAGRVYELWLFRDETPVPAGCLTPKEGSLAAYFDADAGGVDLMAVTVEAAACPDAPTTDPVYTAEVA